MLSTNIHIVSRFGRILINLYEVGDINPSIKKILVLNGSHSEIPLIKAAKKNGFYVITTGNMPELPGHPFADEYQYGDYSNLEEMLALAESLKVDAICAAANDFGAISAAFVAEKLGLPGHDSFATTLLLHQKHRFKEFALRHSIKTPTAVSFSCLDEAVASNCLPFPLMVKPVDLTGGKGICRVDSREEYLRAIENAFKLSREKKIVVEEFFEGTLHSFSTFLIGQKVRHYYSDNEFFYKNPYFVSSSSSPARGIDKHLDGLIAEAQKFACLLNLVDGVLHFQYLATENDFRIIEVTRRCSGDLYPLPVSNALGVDWASLLLRAEAGLDCSGVERSAQTGFHGRCCIMAERNGEVINVEIDPSFKDFVVDEVVWWKKGMQINNYMVDKLGVLILQFPSLEVMDEAMRQLEVLIKVEMA